MKTKVTTCINPILKDEHGVTALETAIILIAFVVAAAIFAYTILSVGTFLTERSKEAAYAGLQEVRGSMELKGSIVLESTGQYVVFNLATVSGGSSQDLRRVKMTYRDSTHNQDVVFDSVSSGDCIDTGTGIYPPAQWSWSAMQTNGKGLKNCILGENGIALAKIMVHIGPSSNAAIIDSNHIFALEIKPPTGGVQLIQRTAPAQVNQITDLK